MKTIIETERLILRQWKEEDRIPFANFNGDPENLPYFPRAFTLEESHQFVDKTIHLINTQGWGLFALERKDTGEFIGFTGLANPTWQAAFTPCTEIGWRLDKNHWGKGFAPEAAKSVLNFAFKDLKLKEVLSFTSLHNLPSISVMEKIGMRRDLDGGFEHPNVEDGHKLKTHVLYRARQWDQLPLD